jgi:cytidyltransferase-like protein
MRHTSKTILSVGSFDVPHMGHAIFLQQASKLGRLVVGVNSDEYYASYKHKKPIFSLSERLYLINMLDFVDSVIVNTEDNLKPLIEEVKPDFLVIGSDWGDRYFEQIRLNRKQLKDMGVELFYIPYTKEISTTMIRKRI